MRQSEANDPAIVMELLGSYHKGCIKNTYNFKKDAVYDTKTKREIDLLPDIQDLYTENCNSIIERCLPKPK